MTDKTPLPPPAGYKSWCEAAIDSMDTRSMFNAQCWNDESSPWPGRGDVQQDEMQVAARAEVAQLREDAARGRAVAAVYERFKHLDLVLRGLAELDDPIYKACAALWAAVADSQRPPGLTAGPQEPTP